MEESDASGSAVWGAKLGSDGSPRRGRRLKAQSRGTAWRMILQASPVIIPPKTARNRQTHSQPPAGASALNGRDRRSDSSTSVLPRTSSWCPARTAPLMMVNSLVRSAEPLPANMRPPAVVKSKVAPWRREGDSNPRYAFRAYNGLANRRLQPLGHLSKPLVSSAIRATMCCIYISSSRGNAPSIPSELTMTGSREPKPRPRLRQSRPERKSRKGSNAFNPGAFLVPDLILNQRTKHSGPRLHFNCGSL